MIRLTHAGNKSCNSNSCARIHAGSALRHANAGQEPWIYRDRRFDAYAGDWGTTAIFSVVNAVLLRALPYRDPARLVSVWEDESDLDFPRNTPAPGNYTDWTKQTQIFESVVAFVGRSYNLTGSSGEPQRIEGGGVTRNFFSTLGATRRFH